MTTAHSDKRGGARTFQSAAALNGRRATENSGTTGRLRIAAGCKVRAPGAPGGFVCRLRLDATLLLLLSPLRGSLAQNNSPVGQWDCVISGSANGLASLTFFSSTNGGTFAGVGILVPKPLPSPRVSL